MPAKIDEIVLDILLTIQKFITDRYADRQTDTETVIQTEASELAHYERPLYTYVYV